MRVKGRSGTEIAERTREGRQKGKEKCIWSRSVGEKGEVKGKAEEGKGRGMHDQCEGLRQ